MCGTTSTGAEATPRGLDGTRSSQSTTCKSDCDRGRTRARGVKYGHRGKAEDIGGEKCSSVGKYGVFCLRLFPCYRAKASLHFLNRKRPAPRCCLVDGNIVQATEGGSDPGANRTDMGGYHELTGRGCVVAAVGIRPTLFLPSFYPPLFSIALQCAVFSEVLSFCRMGVYGMFPMSG